MAIHVDSPLYLKLDRFFVSFDFDEDTFGNSFSTSRGFGRRMALIKNEVMN